MHACRFLPRGGSRDQARRRQPQGPSDGRGLLAGACDSFLCFLSLLLRPVAPAGWVSCLLCWAEWPARAAWGFGHRREDRKQSGEGEPWEGPVGRAGGAPLLQPHGPAGRGLGVAEPDLRGEPERRSFPRAMARGFVRLKKCSRCSTCFHVLVDSRGTLWFGPWGKV